MPRRDYAFPFRIDPTSHQAMQTPYEKHVDDMIRQVLLTSPGERADLPQFGCGLRQMLFAGQSDALVATARIHVQGALNEWLGSQIQLQSVDVISGAVSGDLEEGELLVQVRYTLLETQTEGQLQVKVKAG